MSEADLPRVFLSYGRSDALELADKLAHDLEHHVLAGHARYRAWKDRVEIKSGVPWTDQIVASLRDVAALVALMSPHSVRTRSPDAYTSDSVCLDEISYARFGVKKPIVPVMAVQCEPPFEIFRLDYVDFTRWKDEPRYHAALEKLLGSIAAALRGETRYRHWVDRLQPWDFSAFLENKRRGFVGREWLFAQIVHEVDTANEPAVLVVGEPGIGKSAIVAELVRRNPEGRVIAYHCCQSNVPETLRPGRFVRSVAAMIASRHPRYEALLDRSPYREMLTESGSDRDPESAFEEGVLAALVQVGPPSRGRRVLVVDALDEALRAGDPAALSIVRLLGNRIDRFPDWLKLVATTRDETDVLEATATLKPRWLRASDPQNVRDLATLSTRLSTCRSQPPVHVPLAEAAFSVLRAG